MTHYRKINALTDANLCNVYVFVIDKVQIYNKPSLTIIGSDPTDFKLRVALIFGEKDLALIDQIKFGSILRFQRLKITTLKSEKYENTILARGDLSDTQYGLTLTVIPNEFTNHSINKTIKPISSDNSFTWEDADTKICLAMKQEWLSRCKSKYEHELSNQGRFIAQNINNTTTTTTTTTNSSNKSNIKLNYTSIENLKPHTFVSLIVKILEKSFPMGNSGKRANIKLWDGTGSEASFGPSMEPMIGNTIFANTWEQNLINIIDRLPTDSWVSITGAKVGVYKDILELKLFKNSNITLLEKDNILVHQVMKNYRDSISSDTDRDIKRHKSGSDEDNDEEGNLDQDNQLQEINSLQFTETYFPHIAHTSIEDVTRPDQQVPNKFKIKVTLKQHIPLNIQDFTRLHCKTCHTTAESRVTETNQELLSCNSCSSSDCDFTFLFKLILKDDSGEIPIIVANHSNFFLNTTPSNLYDDKDGLSSLEKKIGYLKKRTTPFDICIVSYYEIDKERTPENVKYQIFDTKYLVE